MGMFVELAIVYRPKKTNCCFLFSFAANKQKFALSVFSRQKEVAVFR
jgi:hypothetical protein